MAKIKKHLELTQTQLKKIVSYDPCTGVFTRLLTNQGAKKGDKAGSISTRGCVVVSVNNYQHKAHRLAWLYMTGSWPMGVIDHKNRNPVDNRFSNLRDVKQSTNTKNCSLSKNNSSGVTGVYKHRGKWCAEIMVNRKKIHIGMFSSLVEAKKCRKKAEKDHGFSLTQGEALC